MDPHQETNNASEAPQSTTEHPTTEIAELKDPEMRDFGWNSPPSEISSLVPDLGNEDIYTLIRRFNKQVFHVKTARHDSALLDLEVSDEEEFTPDKLRATLERLYMTVVVGMTAFTKHIARLRSWNEPRRSTGLCIAYYSAWWLNATIPFLFVTVIILVMDPPSREYLFPPAPLSLVSSTTGNIQKPTPGTVGSKDTLSGVPGAHKGEAAEQEARHFVSGITSLAVSTASGMDPDEDNDDNDNSGGEAGAKGKTKPSFNIQGLVPGAASAAIKSMGKHSASGDVAAEPDKAPVRDAMLTWQKIGPTLRILTNAADTWERFGNALSPIRPFPHWRSRLKIVGPLAALIFITYFTPIAPVMRVISFTIGFAFFGQPLIAQGVDYLTKKVPNWREYIELRRTLLKGVPTNAQLTLTLLRIAEAGKSPLPPPSTSGQVAVSGTENYDPESLDAPQDSLDGDVAEHPVTDASAVDEEGGESTPKRRPGGRIATAVKRTVKAGVGGALNADHLKAKVGFEGAKERVGALAAHPPADDTTSDSDPNRGDSQADRSGLAQSGGSREGPCAFSARMRGRTGHALVVNTATSPCLSFAYVNSTPRTIVNRIIPGAHDKGDKDGSGDIDLRPEYSIGLTEIVELRKIGGYGWKEKLVIGWSTGREVLDGLEITNVQGEKHLLTAIKGRDELFNRLIAMGNHKWESL